MTAVLFSPHNDDETLFAFYSMLKYRPKVVVVLRSFRQLTEQGGPSYTVREKETEVVVGEMLGLDWEQWGYPDDSRGALWGDVAVDMENYIVGGGYDTVIAPAWEENGHEDHNAVGLIAVGLCNQLELELVRYLTYRRGEGRSTHGVPVDHTPEEELMKLQALGIYESQMNHRPTAPWFPGGEYEMLAEFVATT
jgi:LmbE family N-acetylglucosaminyl deacetylase